MQYLVLSRSSINLNVRRTSVTGPPTCCKITSLWYHKQKKIGGFPVLFLFSFSFSNLFMCRKIKVHTKHSRIQTHLFKSLLRHVVHLYPLIYIFLNLFKQRKRIYTLYKYISYMLFSCVHVRVFCSVYGLLQIPWNWKLVVLEKLITDISRKLSIVVKNLSHFCLQILPRRYFLHRQYKGEVVVGNRK